MSLGFGKVDPSDWQKLATGGKQDMVPAGDYFATLDEVVHFEPKGEKGIGTYVLRFVTTTNNEDTYQEKTLECRCMYHPDPPNSINPDGYATMNNISLGKMAGAVSASGGEQVQDPSDGSIDVLASLQSLAGMGKELLGTVKKESYEGREQQSFESFRPVPA